MILLAHVWQSTVCVGVAALLAWFLRHAPARARHQLWLLASAKFLVPFVTVVAAGRFAAPWVPSFVTPHLSGDIHWLDQSSALWDFRAGGGVLSHALLSDLAPVLTWALMVLWASGTAAILWSRWRTWRTFTLRSRASVKLEAGREADAFHRVHARQPSGRAIALVGWDAPVEPVVLGVLRPCVIWPSRLSEHLSDAELEAILAHELCHISRRDNALGVLQIAAEALFWFHPAVWWVGTRLVRERERACDEEVLNMGTDKRIYVEGIMKVCRFCLASPTVGVAGIGGSNLALRVVQIMRHHPPETPSRSHRVLLACVLTLLVATPLTTGLLDAHRSAPGAEQGRDPALAPHAVPAASRHDAANAPQPASDTRSPALTLPKVVTEVHPSYTAAAMQAKVQGQVDMQVVVLASGSVGKVTVTRSLDIEHGLDDQAVKAVKQWRFQPGTKNGKPVPVSVDITMTFTLR